MDKDELRKAQNDAEYWHEFTKAAMRSLDRTDIVIGWLVVLLVGSVSLNVYLLLKG